MFIDYFYCSIGSNPDLKNQASSDTFYFLMHRQEIYVQRVRRIIPRAWNCCSSKSFQDPLQTSNGLDGHLRRWLLRYEGWWSRAERLNEILRLREFARATDVCRKLEILQYYRNELIIIICRRSITADLGLSQKAFCPSIKHRWRTDLTTAVPPLWTKFPNLVEQWD